MFVTDHVPSVQSLIKNLTDTYQKMQMNLINKLTDELKEIKYKGSVVLCGYGEPMLHKDVNIIQEII